MKAAMLERSLRNFMGALQLLLTGLQHHPKDKKLWLMRLHLVALTTAMDPTVGRKLFEEALTNAEQPIDAAYFTLWSHLEETIYKDVARAAAVLDHGCALLQGNIASDSAEWVFIERARLEKRLRSTHEAHLLAQRGLGLLGKGRTETKPHFAPNLLALAIDLEPPMLRPKKARQVVRFVTEEPPILLACARVYYLAKMEQRAVEEIEKVLAVNPRCGDAFGLLYLLCRERTEKCASLGYTMEQVVQRAEAANPNSGLEFLKVAKDPLFVGVEGCIHPMKVVLDSVASRIQQWLSS
jgi:tetratricopeptide (TPR) repeat protein